ncbi:MAG: hypothetical protein QOG13_607 [Sphingomonadales bacterium]|jgi:hypothetical protein|nr:hypothetical protein [Sphingomonadales bacterium]
MIIFDLRCASQGHVFEAWFGSTEEFEAQRSAGLVACPICGAADVDKAPMAPRVGAKGNASGELPAEAVKAALAGMAEAQKKLLETSEHVGDRFPDEARAIHLGEAEARAIHGRASAADAESLRDEGIPIAPLPFDVPDPGTEN